MLLKSPRLRIPKVLKACIGFFSKLADMVFAGFRVALDLWALALKVVCEGHRR